MNTIYDGSFVLGQTSATNFVAGPGIKIDEPSAGTMIIGNDETVLYDNAEGSSTIQLSESLGNFERIRFKIKTDRGFQYCEMSRTVDDLVLMYPHGYSNAWTTWLLLRYNSFTYTLTVTHSKSISHSFTANTTTLGSALDSFLNVIVEVVGINRINA